MACLVQAFRAKELPEIYNEATHIAFAMLSIGLTMSVAMFLFSSLPDLKEQYFSLCLLVILGNYSMLYWLHGYKLKACFLKKKIVRNISVLYVSVMRNIISQNLATPKFLFCQHLYQVFLKTHAPMLP